MPTRNGEEGEPMEVTDQWRAGEKKESKILGVQNSRGEVGEE